MVTNSDALCIHCDAALTPRDLADGWCDSCGKRLPTTIRPKSTAPAPAPTARSGGAGKWVLALGGVAVALLGAAAAFAVAG
jgi:hypothetical protein